MPQTEPVFEIIPAGEVAPTGHFSSDFVARLLSESALLREEVHALREQGIRDRQQANFYKKLHLRATQRLEEKDQEIQALKSKVLELNHRLFGRKSERSDAKTLDTAKVNAKRARGQQPGSLGHGRRHRDNLPVVDNEVLPTPDEIICKNCGNLREPIGEPEVGEEIEWDVRIVRKRTIRKKWVRHKACHCQDGLPDIICAPAPPKLIPKGILSISFIVEVLLEKYLFSMPLHRILAKAKMAGMPLSAGTLCGVLKTITPLFVPLYDGIFALSREQDLALMDETRWFVFIEEAGKTNKRWWLWVVVTAVTRLYILSPSRSGKVPKSYFGFDEESMGIAFHKQVLVDRYGAYAFLKDLLALAYCWAHVRRDFVEASRNPNDLQWAQTWFANIGNLYRLNDVRISLARVQGATVEPPAPFVELDPDRMKSVEYVESDLALREAIEKMAQSRHSELQVPDTCDSRRKILQSMEAHWSGLTLFVDQPQIPMDNNGAERAVRPAAIARKNFYGSAAKWSGDLLVMLMSLLQTLLLHKVDPRKYLRAYLQACADNGSQAPMNITPWLPWIYAAMDPSAENLTQDTQTQGPSP